MAERNYRSVVFGIHQNPSLLSTLKNCGWHNGFDSPFANKETKKLEQKLELKQRNVLLLRYDSEDIIHHVNSLHQHYNNNQRDIDVTHALIRAKRQEVQSESAFLIKAKDVIASTQRNITDLKAKLEEIRERNQKLSGKYLERKPRMDELFQTIESDSELIEIYKKKREACILETMDISKVQSEDENLVKDAEIRVAEASQINKKLRLDLDFKAMSTRKSQEQYARLSREFRQLLQQRQELVKLWNSSLRGMKSRDKEMKQISDDYYDLRSLERQLIADLDAQKDLNQEVKECITERDRQIILIDREKSKLVDGISSTRIRITNLENERSQASIVIKQVCLQIKIRHEFMESTYSQVTVLTEKVNELESVIENLKRRHNEMNSTTLGIEDYIRELEQICTEVDDEIKAKEAEHTLMRHIKFNIEREKQDNILEITSSKSKLIRLTKLLKHKKREEEDNGEQLASLNVAMYKLDLDRSGFEMRISHCLGSSNDPNYLIFKTLVRKKQEEFDMTAKMEKTLLKDLNFIKFKSHNMGLDVESLLKERSHIEDAQNDVLKNIRMLTKIHKDTNEDLRNLRIDHSLKLVDKSRVMKFMKRHRNALFAITQHYETVTAAVKERKSEIRHHLLLLEKCRKQLKSNAGRMTVNHADIHKHAEKLKSKYESLMLLMSPGSEDDVKKQSFGYQIRKIAKQRETLIGEKLRWESRVKEATVEVEGLENVLKTTKLSNEMFKQSLEPAKEGSKEFRLFNQHKTNFKRAMVLRHRLSKTEEVLKEKRGRQRCQYDMFQHRFRITKEKAKEKAISLSKLTSEIDRIRDKLNRWEKLISHKTLTSLYGKISASTTKTIEKKIRINAMGIKLGESIKVLVKLMGTEESLREYIVNYLSSRNHEDLIRKGRDQGIVGISKPKSSKRPTTYGRVRQQQQKQLQ